MTFLQEPRGSVLASFGAGQAEVEELLPRTRNVFCIPLLEGRIFPLPDEPHLERWEFYASEVRRCRSIAVLDEWLPQLQFPIQEGLAATPEYVAAVSRGEWKYSRGTGNGLPIVDPQGCTLEINKTDAGRVPVMYAQQRQDFVSLVQAFTRKNSPSAVPSSMGAVIVAGYNNFDRVHRLREAFGQRCSERSWQEEFAAIRQRREFYQDTFILLSGGPYSGVPATKLEVSDEAWEVASRSIRIEHECTHYFTRRVFGSMKNLVLDELMADYCGISEAAGSFRADWARYFFGLEDEWKYRPGGRLENYCNDLSQAAFEVLQRLVRAAISSLAALSSASVSRRGSPLWRVATLFAIASLSLEEIASASGGVLLVEAFDERFRSLENRAAASEKPTVRDTKRSTARPESSPCGDLGVQDACLLGGVR